MNKQLARILSIVLLIGLSASACGNTAVDETAVVVAADTDATTEIETPAAAVSSRAEAEPAESEPAVASVENKSDTYTVANCEGGTLDA